MEKEKIILTEENVLDVYKKLVNKEEIREEELEAVKQRFYKLLNHPKSPK